jgi:hypothetical protein
MAACTGLWSNMPTNLKDNYWQTVLNNNDYDKTDDPFNYYGNTLRLLSMIMLTGRFENLYLAPSSGTLVRLKNQWRCSYIHREHKIPQTAECGFISGGCHSVQWIIEKNSEGYYTFRNRWIDTDGYTVYLHMSDDGQTASCDYKMNNGYIVTKDSQSAQWILESSVIKGDYVRIKNRLTNKYLEIEHEIDTNQNSKKVEAERLTPDQFGRGSANWYIERVE